jgi:hypothetical protein
MRKASRLWRVQGDSGALACFSKAFVKNSMNGTSFVAGVENPAADPNVTGVGNVNPLIYALSLTQTPAGRAKVSPSLQFFHREIREAIITTR